MKKKMLSIILSVLLIAIPTIANAEAAVGDTVATVGEDLTPQQREDILAELGATDETLIIDVTNAEMRQFLDGVLPPGVMGNQAISSSLITFAEQGTGLVVRTNNITWVTSEMYTNALITAGLRDATVDITAPFGVTGAAALTGIMKAFQVSSGEVIDDEVVRIANEEMATTAELSQDIGNDEANALTARIKEAIAEHRPTSEVEVRDIIINVANDLNLNITEQHIDTLSDLFFRMTQLNIDWDGMANQLANVGTQVSDLLQTEQGQGFLHSVGEFFNWLIGQVQGVFS